MQFIPLIIISQGHFQMNQSFDIVKILKMQSICHHGFGHQRERSLLIHHLRHEVLQLSSALIAPRDACLALLTFCRLHRNERSNFGLQCCKFRLL